MNPTVEFYRWRDRIFETLSNRPELKPSVSGISKVRIPWYLVYLIFSFKKKMVIITIVIILYIYIVFFQFSKVQWNHVDSPTVQETRSNSHYTEKEIEDHRLARGLTAQGSEFKLVLLSSMCPHNSCPLMSEIINYKRNGLFVLKC